VPASRIKEFLAALGFEIDEAGYQRFNRSLASASLRVAAFGAGIQTVAAGAYAFLYKIAQSQSQMLSLSEATGVAVKKLEELNYIAAQTGASQEALSSSLKGLQQAMAGATIGQGGLAAFHRLGIRIKDVNGRLRATDDVLFEIGDRIKNMDRGRQEMFLGQLGVDRSLVKMLTQDVTGLRDAYREMYAAAGTDAQAAAEASRSFIKEIHNIKTVFWMMAKSVGLAVIGRMEADIVRLRKAVVENFGKISRVIQTLLAVLMRLAGAFGALTMRLMGWVGNIVDWFGQLDDGSQRLILAAVGMAAAWRLLNLQFLATPLGLLLSLGAVIVGLVDDFLTWREGGESLIDWGSDMGRMLGFLTGGAAALGAGLIVLPGIVSAVTTAWGILQTATTAVTTALRVMTATAAANPYMAAFLALAFVASLIIANWEKVKAWFGSFVDWLMGKFKWIAESAQTVAGWFSGDEDQPAKIPDIGAPERPSAPLLGPTPALAAAAAGHTSTANINASTVINVEGAGDPAAVGRAVGGEQNRVNADLVRHARGAAR